MNKDTYNILLKIAAGKDDRKGWFGWAKDAWQTASDKSKDAWQVATDKSKDAWQTASDKVADTAKRAWGGVKAWWKGPEKQLIKPEHVYGLVFNGGEPGVTPTSAYYDKQAQAARQAAYKKLIPGARIIPGNRFPVIPYPVYGNAAEDMHRGSLENNYKQGVYNRPLEMVTGKLPRSGPVFISTMNSKAIPVLAEWIAQLATGADVPTEKDGVYGRAYVGDPAQWLTKSRKQVEKLVAARKLDPAKLREIDEMAKPQNNNLWAMIMHEVGGHGAAPLATTTPSLLSGEFDMLDDRMAVNSLMGRKWKNPRGSYGLVPGEATGAMHILKGLWGRRHPNTPLSQDWHEAIEQFKSAGYLGEDGLFTDKLFEGSGYTPFASTINSIMEILNSPEFSEENLKHDSQMRTRKESLLKQLQWYWTQATNRRANEQLQLQLQNTGRSPYFGGYGNYGKVIPS